MTLRDRVIWCLVSLGLVGKVLAYSLVMMWVLQAAFTVTCGR